MVAISPYALTAFQLGFPLFHLAPPTSTRSDPFIPMLIMQLAKGSFGVLHGHGSADEGPRSKIPMAESDQAKSPSLDFHGTTFA